MPYIEKSKRPNIDKALKKFLMEMGPMTPAEHVYVLYQIALWQCSGGGLKSIPSSWTDASRVVADLESVKLEFYRRVVATYEEGKIQDSNFGDLQPIRSKPIRLSCTNCRTVFPENESWRYPDEESNRRCPKCGHGDKDTLALTTFIEVK